MFELYPAGDGGGCEIDRHGVVEYRQALGIAGIAFDAGDFAAHGIVTQHDRKYLRLGTVEPKFKTRGRPLPTNCRLS